MTRGYARRAWLIAALVLLLSAGVGVAAVTMGTTETFTYTVPGTTIAIPAQTYTQTVDVPTITETVTSTDTVTVTAPSTTTSAPSGPAWPDTTPPPMGTPNRVATTSSELKTIVGSLNAGDVVEVKAMTVPGEFVLAAKPSAPASIYFDEGVHFTGTAAGTNLPAVWVHGSNLRLYGGDVSGLGNDCVRVGAASSDTTGPTNLRWWGLTIHDCGASGLSSQASNLPNTGLDIEADITTWGRNLALDPHAIKGTGLHGAYLGGGNAPTTGRFVLDVHDSEYGAGVEAGAYLQDSELWERASNLTWSGQAGQAGNALQPWGAHNANVVVHDLEVTNVTGHALFDESLTGGTGNVIEYARSSGVAMTPYEPSSYIACGDCR